MYLISKTGMTLYSKSLGDVVDDSLVNPQLVGGFMSAIASFASSLYNTNGKINSLYTTVNYNSSSLEQRLYIGDHVNCLLLLNNLNNLDKRAYAPLDDLSMIIRDKVNKEYVPSSSLSDFSWIDSFVEGYISLVKEQMKTTYFMAIISDYIYIKDDDSFVELISRLNEAHRSNDQIYIRRVNIDVAEKISQESRRNYELSRAISKVNSDLKSVWDLFKVPLL